MSEHDYEPHDRDDEASELAEEARSFAYGFLQMVGYFVLAALVLFISALITNDAAAGNSGLAVMRRAGHSDFRVTQQYLDLAGVEFAEEAERAGARGFAHVPRASRLLAKVGETSETGAR